MVQLNDTGSNNAPGGYNLICGLNDVITSPSLQGLTLHDNHLHVAFKIASKSAIKVAPSGWQYVDNFANFGSDPSWINRSNMAVLSTRNPRVANTETAVIGTGKSGTLLRRFEDWILRSDGWLARHAKDAPAMTMPYGRLLGGTIIDGKATIAEMQNRGWMAFENRSLAGRSAAPTVVFTIPESPEFYVAAGNTPYPSPGYPTTQHGINAANVMFSVDTPVIFDQIGEGPYYVEKYSNGYIAFIKRLRERFPTKWIFGSYGQLFTRYFRGSNFYVGGTRNPLDASFTHYYTTADPRKKPDGNWDEFYAPRGEFGHSFHSAGMNQLVQYYPDQPGDGSDFALLRIHELEVMLRQDPNNKPVLFFWPWLEWVGTPAWDGTTWQHKTTSPAGRVLRVGGGIPGIIGPELLGLVFTVLGQGVFFWADAHNYLDSPNLISDTWPDQPDPVWIPVPGGSPSFPYQQPGGERKPRHPQVGHDAAYHGVSKGVRILNHLGTGTVAHSYPAYSVGAGAFTPPTNGTGLLWAAANNLPVVMLLRNAATGKEAVVVSDTYCDPGDSKTVTVNVTGGTINVPCEGNAVHVVLIN